MRNIPWDLARRFDGVAEAFELVANALGEGNNAVRYSTPVSPSDLH